MSVLSARNKPTSQKSFYNKPNFVPDRRLGRFFDLRTFNRGAELSQDFARSFCSRFRDHDCSIIVVIDLWPRIQTTKAPVVNEVWDAVRLERTFDKSQLHRVLRFVDRDHKSPNALITGG